MSQETTSRATLGGKLSAVLIAAGSAVGLGNIWRFPYLTSENGGSAFLIIYIGCVLLLGLPLILAEFTVGRATHLNSVGAFRSLNKRWSCLGYNSVLVAFMILGFYYVVSGWALAYMLNSATGALLSHNSVAEFGGLFNGFVTNSWQPIIYAVIFVLMTHYIIAAGVQKGIERFAKWLMPLLFIVLIFLVIYALTLPGSSKGLAFLFKPEFSKVSAKTVLDALGQAFFSLSVGMGCLVTYASYFNEKTNLRHTALNVTIIDTVIAIMAGVIIFPVLFSQPNPELVNGPQLTFVVLPSIFSTLPLGSVWSAVFFLLLIVAAITSTISIHEVPTAYFEEEFKMSRHAASWLTTAITATMAAVASLSMGVLQDFKIFKCNFFDLLDKTTANVMMPLGGILTCIFVGWVLDQQIVKRELTNNGTLNLRLFKVLQFLLRYFCPIALTIILLSGLGLFDRPETL